MCSVLIGYEHLKVNENVTSDLYELRDVLCDVIIGRRRHLPNDFLQVTKQHFYCMLGINKRLLLLFFKNIKFLQFDAVRNKHFEVIKLQSKQAI